MTMRRLLIAFALFGHLVLSVFAFAGTLATFQSFSSPEFVKKDCRGDMSLAAGLAILPAAAYVLPFLTGFYEKGFQWSCGQPR